MFSAFPAVFRIYRAWTVRMIHFSDKASFSKELVSSLYETSGTITNQFEFCFIKTSSERHMYRRPGRTVLHTACIHLGDGNTHIDIFQVQDNIERALLFKQYIHNCK